MSHAVHKITHAVSHVVHEAIKHPLEIAAIGAGSLLIPGVGSAVGSALGLSSSAATTGLATMGAMPDTALGAAEATGGLATLGTSSALSLGTLANVAKVGSAVAGVVSLANKPKVNIPQQSMQPLQPKPRAPVISGKKFASMLGNTQGLFGLTKTKYGGSSGSFAVDLSDKFSLL